MPWVESASPSFRARHDSAHAGDAERVLVSLERTRERLAHLFPQEIEGFTVVMHGSTLSLTLANPMLPLVWLATAPAARRSRASNVPGSREMLALSAAALYARRVVIENNRQLSRAHRPARAALELRWAWLVEGASRWFSGQTEHSRPAIARRLHEGRRPQFPPGLRDAPLLGGTVIDLLAREEGEEAAAEFVRHLHPQGARAALSTAFPGRAFVHTEDAWRTHLARIAGGG